MNLIISLFFSSRFLLGKSWSPPSQHGKGKPHFVKKLQDVLGSHLARLLLRRIHNRNLHGSPSFGKELETGLDELKAEKSGNKAGHVNRMKVFRDVHDVVEDLVNKHDPEGSVDYTITTAELQHIIDESLGNRITDKGFKKLQQILPSKFQTKRKKEGMLEELRNLLLLEWQDLKEQDQRKNRRKGNKVGLSKLDVDEPFWDVLKKVIDDHVSMKDDNDEGTAETSEVMHETTEKMVEAEHDEPQENEGEADHNDPSQHDEAQEHDEAVSHDQVSDEGPNEEKMEVEPQDGQDGQDQADSGHKVDNKMLRLNQL